MYCKHSNLVKSFDSYSKVFFNIQEMIHDASIGVYEYEGIRFQINEKNNTINNLKYMNPNWNYLIKDPICIFE
jgi:hypothetical protein